MYKTKIFTGNAYSNPDEDDKPADIQFNEWIEDHEKIEILDFTYRMGKYGNHSIAILYEDERRKANV